jgi:predicted Zn finger-like uncharacterized protein
MFTAPLRTLTCPLCQVALRLQDGQSPLGGHVRCSKCQGVFAVPPPALTVVPPDAAPCPLCDVLLKLPAHVPAGKTIKCPHCAGRFPPKVPASCAPKTVLANGEPSATGKSKPKTQVVIKPPSSRPKTQLAPAPPPPQSGDILFSDPDDQDVLDVRAPSAARPAAPLIGDAARHAGEPVVSDTVKTAFPPLLATPETTVPPTEAKQTPAAIAPSAKQRSTATKAARTPASLEKRRPEPKPRPKPAPEPTPSFAAPSPAISAEDEPDASAVKPTRPSYEKPRHSEAPAPIPSAPRAVSARGMPAWVKPMLIGIVVVSVALGGYYCMPSDLFGMRRRTVYATEGSVYFQGKPAAGARVTLIPVDKSRDRYFPTGKVGDDGTFKLTTYEPEDGAPAGRYRMTVTRGQMEADEYAELSKKMSPAEITHLMRKRSRDPLFDKYANARDSGLTVEITSQPYNKLDRFNLK